MAAGDAPPQERGRTPYWGWSLNLTALADQLEAPVMRATLAVVVKVVPEGGA